LGVLTNSDCGLLHLAPQIFKRDDLKARGGMLSSPSQLVIFTFKVIVIESRIERRATRKRNRQRETTATVWISPTRNTKKQQHMRSPHPSRCRPHQPSPPRQYTQISAFRRIPPVPPSPSPRMSWIRSIRSGSTAWRLPSSPLLSSRYILRLRSDSHTHSTPTPTV
jgi:hypothetical protein